MNEAAAPHPTYRQRRRPVGGTSSFRLEGETLIVDTGRREDRVRLSGVRRVRLSYAPQNLSNSGFKTALTLADGKTLSFTNLDWQGIARVENRNGQYRSFLSDLLPAIAVASPRCEFLAGRPPVSWALGAGLGTLAVGGAAAAAFVFWQRGAGGAALIAAVVALPLAWQQWRMTVRNRPRTFEPARPPEAVLPPAPAEADIPRHARTA